MRRWAWPRVATSTRPTPPRGPSPRRGAVREAVTRAFAESGGTYGYRRLLAEVNGAGGVEAGEWTVRRIMREEGLAARSPRKKRRYSSYAGEVSEAPGEHLPGRRGKAPLRRRRPERAVGHRHHRVQDPRGQVLPVSGDRLLRRHAHRLVDRHVPERGARQLFAPAGVRPAQGGGASAGTRTAAGITAGRAGSASARSTGSSGRCRGRDAPRTTLAWRASSAG